MHIVFAKTLYDIKLGVGRIARPRQRVQLLDRLRTLRAHFYLFGIGHIRRRRRQSLCRVGCSQRAFQVIGRESFFVDGVCVRRRIVHGIDLELAIGCIHGGAHYVVRCNFRVHRDGGD